MTLGKKELISRICKKREKEVDNSIELNDVISKLRAISGIRKVERFIEL